MQAHVQEAKEVPISSEVVVFPSRSGKRIVGFIDRAGNCSEQAPWVVVCPKFGESKKNNLQLSYQLAANGLKVLRFDHTNHVGESDGEIENYTFSGAIDDIQSAIDFLELKYLASSVKLVANSLSARCALRVAAIDGRVSQLVNIVGVINFQHTACEVYQRDMVAEYLDGKMQGISDILGHQVDVDAFLKDCIGKELHDLEGALKDIRAIRCPVLLFSAERDVWVLLDEVEQLKAICDQVQVYRIPDAMHELRENPQATREAINSMVYAVAHGELPLAGETEAVVSLPSKEGLFSQNKIERERLRAAAPLRESEQEFWNGYLQKYNILESVGDYQKYVELIGECLGPIETDRIYFDCGCGNGLFGAWCLRDLLLRSAHEGAVPPVYFGLDLTAKGLGDALVKHRGVRESAHAAFPEIGLLYYRFDLDDIDGTHADSARLPFNDATLDRICCSLLISYLKNPIRLIEEFKRILKPGGKLIVSSMKPFCDLSIIYKDVVEESDNEGTLQSARELLSAAGAIKLKEEEGHYKFYEKEELVDLMQEAGFKKPQVFRSFGDQVNLVFVEK